MEFDVNELDEMLKRAEKGDVKAQGMIAALYLWGLSVKKSPEEAAKWAEKAEKNNDPNGQLVLARLFDKGISFPRDTKKAFDLYKKSAEQGNRWAQCSLGQAYYCGRGVERDHHLAEEWFTKGSNNGDARSQTNLGLLYLTKNLTKKRTLKTKRAAYLWLSTAIKHGEAALQVRIAKKIAGLFLTRKQASEIDAFIRSLQ